jgi:hypothetical protein
VESIPFGKLPGIIRVQKDACDAVDCDHDLLLTQKVLRKIYTINPGMLFQQRVSKLEVEEK